MLTEIPFSQQGTGWMIKRAYSLLRVILYRVKLKDLGIDYLVYYTANVFSTTGEYDLANESIGFIEGGDPIPDVFRLSANPNFDLVPSRNCPFAKTT